MSNNKNNTDNPLGVKKGDIIRVWDSIDKFDKEFLFYEERITHPWVVMSNNVSAMVEYKYAEIIPEPSEGIQPIMSWTNNETKEVKDIKNKLNELIEAVNKLVKGDE